jgi:peptidoglycan-associated lipoprotein
MGPYQSPTPSGSYSNSGSGDFIVLGNDDFGLTQRDANEDGDLYGEQEDGYFNGKKMLTGTLKPTYFSFDSTAVEALQRTTLQASAKYLINNPEYDLLIEGHCDWYGTEDYNLQLSDRRANSVSVYLQDLGVNSSRIKTVPKGSLEAEVGLTKSRASKDRRADLILLK